MNIAVIPAKGTSRRIPQKNRRLFHGQPIIGYSIIAAHTSGLFDAVIVSSDDEEILGLAQKYQFTKHRRHERLCLDPVGTLEVTAAVAREYPRADCVCCIYATAPMLLPAHICRGYDALSSTQAAHCIAVGTEPLRDAGMFYWSLGEAARGEKPYYEYLTVVEPIPENRVCDINTPEDWTRAEGMFAKL